MLYAYAFWSLQIVRTFCDRWQVALWRMSKTVAKAKMVQIRIKCCEHLDIEVEPGRGYGPHPPQDIVLLAHDHASHISCLLMESFDPGYTESVFVTYEPERLNFHGLLLAG
jgi:hypothetical protein